tara:strand:- start:1206 stop:1451 length:246 start_codon:yes stop_codon:yes gene_type:complete
MMTRVIKTIATFLLILPIKCYQILLSPLFPKSCRFEPTCSNYFIQAIKKFGPIYGFWLGIIRISKCHPWGEYGYDPVPERE